jgi:curved DNA-binding protein
MQNLRTPVKNYYEILGVASNASADEIKMAFRRLARRYHPDVNPGDKSAEETFKQINEAYDTLSDETKRQQYELQFFGSSKRRKSPRNGSGTNGRKDFDFPQFSDFNNFVDQVRQRSTIGKDSAANSTRFRPTNTEAYRPGTTKRAKAINSRPLPRDIEAKLTLPLEKAYQGGRERIRLEDGRSLEVDMPPGMYDGQKIRLRGQGIKDGDLYLKISIAPHPFFKINGADICCQIPLTPSEAILGGAVEVPTIDGLVKMNVPPGVKPGQRLRLANKGYPNIRGERGDQLVVLQISVPQEISQQERELYEKIRQLEKFNPREHLLD